jgi:hypothetical protein
MITSETPYKLADIIRDTWPGLYRSHKVDYNDMNINSNVNGKSSDTPTNDI